MYLIYCTFYHYFRVYVFYLLKKMLTVQQYAVLRLQLSAVFRLLYVMAQVHQPNATKI